MAGDLTRARGLVLALTAAVALVAFAGAGSAADDRAQAAPVERQQPFIEGTPIDNRTLTANPGLWDNNPTSFRYQWRRCDRDGNACSDIGGARDRQYRVRDADVGRTLLVLVTACNADGCTTANSKLTAVVSGDRVPRNVSRPSISGKAEIGSILTATRGTWSEGPTVFFFQWLRCDAAGSNCARIPTETNSTYLVRAEDGGRRLRVEVTARNLVGSGSAISPATSVVPAAPAGPAGQIRLPNGQTSIPVTSVGSIERLIIDRVEFSPTAVRSRTEPITVRVHISDTRNYVIRDALVYIRSTPLVTSTPPEQVTGTDGWVTFQTVPERDFSLVFRPDYNLQFFVRARKPGDNVLAGVSARRLVQVAIRP